MGRRTWVRSGLAMVAGLAAGSGGCQGRAESSTVTPAAQIPMADFELAEVTIGEFQE